MISWPLGMVRFNFCCGRFHVLAGDKKKNKCKMVTVVGSAKEMSLELWGVSHAGRSVSQASQRNWQFS